MPTIEKIVQDLDDTSSKIGEITRTISLSALALVWLFIAGGDDSPSLPIKPGNELLLLSGAFALLSLLADYFQYVVGYANSKDVLTVAEAAEAKSAKYNTDSFLYKLRTFFFWSKQVLALVSLVLLFIAIGGAYFSCKIT